MRLVCVFDMRDPEGAPYAFRAPSALAWLVCRFSRHMDYAINWW